MNMNQLPAALLCRAQQLPSCPRYWTPPSHYTYNNSYLQLDNHKSPRLLFLQHRQRCLCFLRQRPGAPPRQRRSRRRRRTRRRRFLRRAAALELQDAHGAAQELLLRGGPGAVKPRPWEGLRCVFFFVQDCKTSIYLY